MAEHSRHGVIVLVEVRDRRVCDDSERILRLGDHWGLRLPIDETALPQ